MLSPRSLIYVPFALSSVASLTVVERGAIFAGLIPGGYSAPYAVLTAVIANRMGRRAGLFAAFLSMAAYFYFLAPPWRATGLDPLPIGVEITLYLTFLTAAIAILPARTIQPEVSIASLGELGAHFASPATAWVLTTTGDDGKPSTHTVVDPDAAPMPGDIIVATIAGQEIVIGRLVGTVVERVSGRRATRH